jgi:hypothetical protein
MMRDDELEQRIREAMPHDEALTRTDLWRTIAAQRGGGARVALPLDSRRRPVRWAFIVGAAAAGIALLIPVLQGNEPPPVSAPRAARSVPGDNFFLPAALLAQSSSAPAYPQLSRMVRRDLEPGRWVLGQVDGGKVREQYAYSLSRSSYEGQPAWLVVSHYWYGSEVRKLDSLWTSTDSLAPRIRISHSGAMRTEETYRADDILTGVTQNGYTAWSSKSIRTPSWDVLYGVLQVSTVALRFQSTPLSRDWKRSLPYPALTSRNTVVYLNWVVDGEEEIEVPAGKFMAWRIRLQIGDKTPPVYDPANPPEGIYYWVSKDRQWMLRMLFQGSGGPHTTPIVLLSGSEE